MAKEQGRLKRRGAVAGGDVEKLNAFDDGMRLKRNNNKKKKERKQKMSGR